MADTPETTSFQTADGRKLRKIKRPIKKLTPNYPNVLGGGTTSQQGGGMRVSPGENLDELLDSQLNLPALNGTRSNIPPSGKAQNAQQNSNDYYRPNRFIREEDLLRKPKFLETLMEGDLFTLKGVAIIAVLVFIFGILAAKVFSGGKTIVKDGLQGVVVNAEVPRGRARCGVAERNQGCVLYIMNPQRQDLQGRDFYDLASQLTGRQRFVVETGNMRYSSVKVRPGDIAQINIPPLQ